MARDTGLPETDAQFDFGRARRRRAMSRLAAALRREPSDVNVILPFDEVVEALGRRGERRLGLQTIPLDSIVGTVDRSREFDRAFRPTSSRVRPRWERIAMAQRKGQAMPPIDVYRIGELHFVKDGHHRVSVARELGHEVIEAYVTEVITELGADLAIRMHDLALKSHERLFFELYAHALQGRAPGSADFLRDIVESWLAPIAAIRASQGIASDKARAQARLDLAMTRGLLLDLLATGDRAGADAAAEQAIALYEAWSASVNPSPN